MTMTYTYAKAKQSFDLVLKKASSDGIVQIKKDDQLFVVMLASTNTSPLDVKGIKMSLTAKEIVGFIHEGRKSK